MKEWNEHCPKCGGSRLQVLASDYLTDTYKHRCMDCEYTFKTTMIEVIVEGDAILSMPEESKCFKSRGTRWNLKRDKKWMKKN